MTKVKLETVCEILDSQRIPVTASERKKGIYPYYGANGLQDYVDSYIFDDELILLAEDGGNFNSKTKPIAYRVSGKCWVNNHAHVLKAKEGNDVDFLCYALMFYDVSSLIKGATRKKLTQKDMREMLIPLYPLEKQKDLANKLGEVDNIIAKRKQQLEKLDLLVKAKFYEMFGDPIVNSRGLPTVPLSRLAFLKSGKNVTSKDIHEYTDSTPYPCFGGNGIRGYVSKFSHDGEYCLIGRQGALCGNVQFAKGKFYATEHAVVVSLSQNDNTIWLYHCLKYLNLNRLQTGAAQPGLNIDILNQVDIPRPPLELQNEFAHFVEQAEKIKIKIKQSLEKLELLKQSLLQKYFG